LFNRLLTAEVDGGSRTKLSGRPLPAETHMSRMIVPKNLLGALWLQLENAIAGNIEYRNCKGCGSPFEVSVLAGRSDKWYCHDLCRCKALRERRKQAAEMFEQGMSVEEIAEKMNADAIKVTGWLRSRRKEV